MSDGGWWGLLAILLLPALLGAQETEEQRYAPATVLDCDLVAVGGRSRAECR